ncbi:hypothetical protein COT48_02030 [Candidatus Woesearchaeota archaeon CG08_land_8_20_14_0_20_47_9]|nr:MAG: hypothetical protein COT48_02030 [Candidatus Woesearchaeota archaeon CG08_land_8_20_14_0_20_47_9]
MLHRSFDLIVEGLKGGGKTAELIDRIVENIEETKELKREMIATNLNYVIFITFIVIIITPGLFTLSYQFLTILKGFSTKLGGTGASSQMSLPINFGAISLDPGVFKRFSMYTISLISVFSSMMISIMQNGNIKGGVKYIPFFALASVGLYLLFMHFACQIFGSIFV